MEDVLRLFVSLRLFVVILLDLDFNCIGLCGVEVIVNVMSFLNIREFCLSFNQLMLVGFVYLILVENMYELCVFDFEVNGFGLIRGVFYIILIRCLCYFCVCVVVCGEDVLFV